MRKGKGKGLVRRLFVPSCDWPSILVGHSPCVQAWGRLAIQSLQVFQNERLGLEWISGTVSLFKFVKVLGQTIGPSPEDLSENCLKFIKLSKQWGAFNRRAPEKIYFFKR